MLNTLYQNLNMATASNRTTPPSKPDADKRISLYLKPTPSFGGGRQVTEADYQLILSTYGNDFDADYDPAARFMRNAFSDTFLSGQTKAACARLVTNPNCSAVFVVGRLQNIQAAVDSVKRAATHPVDFVLDWRRISDKEVVRIRQKNIS